MNYVGIFFAAFLYVVLRVLQQRNVVFNNYWWIPPTSYMMAAGDVFLITSFAKAGWSPALIFWYGTAGACGCFFAMWFHKRFIGGK
jgi:hypothetical protein